MTLSEVLNNLAIQNLLQQKALVQAEYEQELQRRKEAFPTVKQAKARLDELDRQIAAIASGIRQTLRGNYQTALAQEQALEAQIAQLKRSEEHTSELQSLMRISYAVFCLKQKRENREVDTNT